ncbi:MAG TPA: 3-hydroxyacyl-CoA dehydrogenase family protein [Deltaproteobacteria bacterium]|nr:3-hydroxyacyl-CoA dehydrogenase family protein [Deltaproteobacteria bacterium]
MDIKRILVVGSGVMGHGIALVAARSGFDVSIVDVKEEFLQKGMHGIKRFLSGSVERGKMTQQEADSALSRIRTSVNMEAEAAEADFVIEAVFENKEVKASLFSQLNKICKGETIFASNTSQLSITELGLASGRAELLIGMHWFNPPPLMRLIEIPIGEKTSRETVETTIEVSRKMGKQPFTCKDSPGFIVNRILNPWYNEGMNLLDEGVATAEDIDIAIKVGGGFRMGPLELRDLVGLDTALHVTEDLYQRLGNDKFRPPACLKNLVAAGKLGRKTGEGFYRYDSKK